MKLQLTNHPHLGENPTRFGSVVSSYSFIIQYDFSYYKNDFFRNWYPNADGILGDKLYNYILYCWSEGVV